LPSQIKKNARKRKRKPRGRLKGKTTGFNYQDLVSRQTEKKSLKERGNTEVQHMQEGRARRINFSGRIEKETGEL